MGQADYYAAGDWNFFCDMCGKKGKASQAVKTWKNTYVCASHKEVRNPQDFLKGVPDPQSTPWSRTDPPPVFVPSSSPLMDTYGTMLLDTNGQIIYTLD